MFFRIFPQKDTFITNYQRGGVPQTGSNFGASEILHLLKKAGISGSVGTPATSSIARVISQFDLSPFSDMIAAGRMPASAIFRLHMSDAQHCGTVPASLDVEVQALSQSWDEGNGRDVDNFADKGVANWEKAHSNQYWDIFGAVGSGSTSTFHFDTGHEDLDTDVSDIVNAWLTGAAPNDGFLVKISSSQELDSQDYYIKMFHARNTHFPDRRPYIEARWDDSVKDDRNNFFWDVPGNLYLYNVIRGQPTNIPSIGTGSMLVRVSDKSGSITVITGSFTGVTGIYSASFTVPTGSYSGSLWSDVWYDPANSASFLMSGAFGIGDDEERQDLSPLRYFVTVTNLRESYESDEDVRLNLYVRPHDYNPAQVLTASLDSLGTVITKAYYRIVNDRTEDVVVPFSTGALEYTRLSYDRRGNYMRLNVGSLSSGNVYRLTFLLDVDGQKQYVDQDLKFRVV